jgi:hypothetical protein
MFHTQFLKFYLFLLLFLDIQKPEKNSKKFELLTDNPHTNNNSRIFWRSGCGLDTEESVLLSLVMTIKSLKQLILIYDLGINIHV